MNKRFNHICTVSRLSPREKIDILNHLGNEGARDIDNINETQKDGNYDAVIIASDGMCCDEEIAKFAFALKLPTFTYQRSNVPRDPGFISIEFRQGIRNSTGATLRAVANYTHVGDGTVVLR